MPWMALAFLAGIVGVETRADLAEIGRFAPLLVAALCLIRLRPARLLALLALGVLWAWWRADLRLDERLDAALEGRTFLLVGDVVSIPGAGAGRAQFDFAPTRTPDIQQPALIRLSWYDAPRIPRAGERWQLEVRLRQPRGFANPGGFDYEGQLFREAIGATGYVRGGVDNRLIAAPGWRHPILRVRAAIAERMSRVLGDSPATGVLIGLAVGATPGIGADQWRVFSATGTTHLIAISGLHVTMVAALAMLIAGGLWRALPHPPGMAKADAAALCGAAAALAYSLLAGFSVPTQRTLAMLMVALAAGWLRRAQPPTHTLALALFAVLLIDPHAVLAPGFWLSFCAVGAILLALHGGRMGRSRLEEFLRTQGAVTLALAPATLALFGTVSLISPAANLLAIPLFSAVLVPLTLIAVALLATAAPLGEWLLQLCARIFELAWPLFERASAWPGALVHLPTPAPWLLSSLALAALVAILPWPVRLRLLGIAVVLPLLFTREHGPDPGAFDVDVLDVGQGLAVVVRTRRHTLLYDAGPSFRGGRSAGELAVVPFLYHGGVKRIDLLVLSHADSDHAGGFAAVAAALPVLAIRHGGAMHRTSIPHAPCLRGEAWNWDGVRFELLHPGSGERWSDNDGSCVLRISTPGHSILLAGDIEMGAELHLAALGLIGRTDVVVVPHHGSRSSSTEALVRGTRARYAIVSAGHANRWHFPHEPVVERWCASGATLIETSQWGAVSLRLGPTGAPIEPGGFRRSQRRYWHADAARAGASRCVPNVSTGPVSVPAAVRYHPARSSAAEEPAQHVGNCPGGRPVHVAPHIVLDRRGRHRPGAALDAAAQAGPADRAHRPGVEVAQRQPGQ